MRLVPAGSGLCENHSRAARNRTRRRRPRGRTVAARRRRSERGRGSARRARSSTCSASRSTTGRASARPCSSRAARSRCPWCHNPEGIAAAPGGARRRRRAASRCGACAEACPRAGGPLPAGAALGARRLHAPAARASRRARPGAREVGGPRRGRVGERARRGPARPPLLRGVGRRRDVLGRRAARPAGVPARAASTRCRRAGLHTAVDTCGFAPREIAARGRGARRPGPLRRQAPRRGAPPRADRRPARADPREPRARSPRPGVPIWLRRAGDPRASTTTTSNLRGRGAARRRDARACGG